VCVNKTSHFLDYQVRTRTTNRRLYTVILFLKLYFADAEQREIYHAARTIQHAFRKRKMQVCKMHVQPCACCVSNGKIFTNSCAQAQKLRHSKEKHAAVLIETYYKKYREVCTLICRTFMHVCVFVCMHMCVYVSTCVRACVCVCVCVCIAISWALCFTYLIDEADEPSCRINTEALQEI